MNAFLKVFKLLLFSVPCCIAQQLEEGGGGEGAIIFLCYHHETGSNLLRLPSDTGYYLVLEWIWIRKLELLYLDEVNSAWVIVIWSVSSPLIGERSNTTKLKSHPQSQDDPRKAKLSSSEGADFSPNILVVSTVGFVVGASFFVVLLIVVKSSTVCRHREATVSDSQEDDIVTEVIAMEPPCNSAQIEQGETLW